MGNYDLEKVRSTVRAQLKGASDPTEFRPSKVDAGKIMHWYFFVLPPIMEGQLIGGGKIKAAKSMETFFLRNGYHYIENRRVGCPRQILGEQCQLCELGWEMVNELDQTDPAYQVKRQKIMRDMIASGNFKVNLYFPPMKANPPDCQDVVKWYDAPKTIVDQWYACLSRDDCGDPEVPQPFGVFFDEDNAQLFDLTAVKDGQNNGYKQSKFVQTAPRPLSKDPKKIKAILAARHDLWAKLSQFDPDLLSRTVAKFSNSSAPNFNVDESQQRDESAEAQKPQKAQPPKAQPSQPVKQTTQPPKAAPQKQVKPAKQPEPELEIEEPPFDDPVLAEETVAEEAAPSSDEKPAVEDWEQDVNSILDDLNGENEELP